MPTLTEILSRRPAVLHSLSAEAPVRDAVRVMAAEGVGAVLVTKGNSLAGIFTERDLLTRVVARDGDLGRPLGEVMTPDPVTVGPTDTRSHVIEQMRQLNCRHLPVVVDGKAVDMVSIRDLVFDELRERNDEVAELHRYIHQPW